MGLIPYILRSIVNLLFIGMDILMVVILVKVTHDRWKLPWLKPFANMVEPAVQSIVRPLGTWLVKKTGRFYSEKTCLVVLILGLTIVRLVICILV